MPLDLESVIDFERKRKRADETMSALLRDL
jgi:hypothetical protein